MTATLDAGVVLRVAVRAVAEPLAGRARWQPAARSLTGVLAELGACFVTLHGHGGLLGCIGSLVAHRPLGIDVAANAAAAAFDDPRLPPVTVDDVPLLHVEVSVLSELVMVPATGWDDLAARLRPGVDGVLIADEEHRATFLPAVWESLPDAEDFLSALWDKARLPSRRWSAGLAVHRYEVDAVGGWARDYVPTLE